MSPSPPDRRSIGFRVSTAASMDAALLEGFALPQDAQLVLRAAAWIPVVVREVVDEEFAKWRRRRRP